MSCCYLTTGLFCVPEEDEIMENKAIGVLLQQYVRESHKQWKGTNQEFASKFGIKATTLHKLLTSFEPSFNTSVVDRILNNNQITIRYLLDRYGEFSEK